jgi:hypothetical protein
VAATFLTPTTGSILSVVVQLLGVAHRAARRKAIVRGLFPGPARFVTDLLVTAA